MTCKSQLFRPVCPPRLPTPSPRPPFPPCPPLHTCVYTFRAIAPNLNAAIGGGPADAERGSTAGGHGLCGGIADRKGFMAGGAYGPTAARGVYKLGEPMLVQVKVTAYHWGWFEFRLAKPGGADQAVTTKIPITQDMLNKHVLEIDPSTPGYTTVVDYDGMGGLSGKGGEYKCKTTGGHMDPKSATPNDKWPHGTCCNGGGSCSAPSQNRHRYVIENAPVNVVNSHRIYAVHLTIPESLGTCDRCVLQWTYITANS